MSNPEVSRVVGHTANGQSLEVEDIVAAALRVGTGRGFDALTMRALAEELGVSAMATYHHVRSKTALFDLIIDTVLEPVEIPPPSFGDWSARLRELQRRSSEPLQAWPGLDVLIYSRPPTAHGWRLMDGYLRILLDGGFTPRNAVLAFGVIHSYGMGRTYVEHRLPDRSAGSGQAALRREWPALREVENLWPVLHRPDVRRFADDVILDGLRAMLAAQEQSS
jgi:AcrR family transcriptional regulator